MLPLLSTRHDYLLLFILCLLGILGLMASDIYLPAFPVMAADLQTTHQAVQATITSYLLGFSIAQVFYGSLADRFGRKYVLLGGMILYILFSIACTVADSIQTLIICRFFQAIGACAGPVITRAIINDRFKREDGARVYASIFPVIGLSPAVSPLLGGFLTTYLGWRANFGFVGGLGLLSTLLVALSLRETLLPAHRIGISMRALFSHYRMLLSQRLYLSYCFIVCAAYGSYFAFLCGSPFIFSALGYSADKIGFFYISIALAYMSGNLLGKKLIKTIAIDTVLMGGIGIFMGAGIVLFMMTVNNGIHHPSHLLIPMTVVAFSNGFLLPLGIASGIALFPHMAGTASGLLGALQSLFAALGAKMVSSTADVTGIWLAYTILGANVLAVLSMGFIWLQKSKSDLLLPKHPPA